MLGIQEDILEVFFNRLKDTKLPPNVIRELRKLWENSELDSKENILNALKREI